MSVCIIVAFCNNNVAPYLTARAVDASSSQADIAMITDFSRAAFTTSGSNAAPSGMWRSSSTTCGLSRAPSRSTCSKLVALPTT
jgi:hypothetical protein